VPGHVALDQARGPNRGTPDHRDQRARYLVRASLPGQGRGTPTSRQ